MPDGQFADSLSCAGDAIDELRSRVSELESKTGVLHVIPTNLALRVDEMERRLGIMPAAEGALWDAIKSLDVDVRALKRNAAGLGETKNILDSDRPTQGEKFSWALHQLKEGRRVRRRWWASAVYIRMRNGEIIVSNESVYRWPIVQPDILAEDWELAD